MSYQFTHLLQEREKKDRGEGEREEEGRERKEGEREIAVLFVKLTISLGNDLIYLFFSTIHPPYTISKKSYNVKKFDLELTYLTVKQEVD